MKMIVDCGATSSRWLILTPDAPTPLYVTGPGFNPVQQPAERLAGIIRSQLLPALPASTAAAIDHIHYYGAGCKSEASLTAVRGVLSEAFPEVQTVEVASDLLATARALCGHRPGIACILGTGSNSCRYDGSSIVQNTPSLGYILGDEGSGAYLGRHLLSDVLKQLLPEELIREFRSEYPDALEGAVIERVYRGEAPAAYLGSFAPFLAVHIDHPAIAALVDRAFDAFFTRNLSAYGAPGAIPVHFTGSIALHFAERLHAAAARSGHRVGIIEPNPLERLIAYHS